MKSGKYICFLLFISSTLIAGNKVLIEQEVKKMDELNKRVVRSGYSNLNKDVDIKTEAYVVGAEGNETIDIVEQNVSSKYKSEIYKEKKINVPK